MSTLLKALKVFHIKKHHKPQMHCKQGKREHGLNVAVMYKEVFPIAVWSLKQSIETHEDMIDTPARLRYEEHPSPLSISISEPHSCHFCIKMNGMIFKGLNKDITAKTQRQLTKLHTGKLCPDLQSHQDRKLCRILLVSSVFYLTKKIQKYWHITFKAAFILIQPFHSPVWSYFSLYGESFNLKIDFKMKYISSQIFVSRIKSPDSGRSSPENKLLHSVWAKVLT